jgi:hypothetical protein
MQSIKLLNIILLILITNATFSQNEKGFIRGSVFDGSNGEFLPGVTVIVEGTTMGTITDLDGKFSLSIKPGTYQLALSFVSYATLNINNVKVEANKVVLLENLKLKEVGIQLGEIIITAKYIRNTEAALLTMKQKSGNLIDGISSVGLRKTGDSDAASSIKRVTGVSVEGGKYIYVRGLGDRYTKTIMNGLDIPGLDPDRNTIQMDIFPTNIIDNIIVSKSFSADLPAGFTGGVININIKDFPETKKVNISLSVGYNENSHFNSDFLTYNGGKTDWLGFDDGIRDIPAIEYIPFFAEVIGDVNGILGTRYKSILQSFNPTMAAKKTKSFMDFSIGTSFGNQFQSGKFTLGYIFSLSYKNNTDFYKNTQDGRYGLSSDPDLTEMKMRELREGNYGVNNVLISGLAGFALKTKHAKYRINLMHLQNGESQAGIFDFSKNNQGSSFSGFQHNLEYNQRSLTNVLVDGKYTAPESKWNVEWKLSPTLSSIKSPDIRFTRYEDRDGTYTIGTEVGFPERIWRNLKEINLAGVLHLTKNLKVKEKDIKLKSGGAYTYKKRDFTIRNYAINIRNIPLTGDPDEIFNTNNLWPYGGNSSKGTTYEASFIPNNPNKFNSNVHNVAGYVSFELSLFEQLKTIVGVRAEKYVQRYSGRDQQEEHILDNEKVLDDIDFFPSVNFILKLSDKQNLRFSYAKTIARPSFKELSYAEIFDPISGKIFIGGLFRDADDFNNIEYWNGNLTSTDIHNFDLRWEIFYGSGRTISTSIFYKTFNRPIEIVQYATLSNSFQPRNVGNGKVFGVEIELRQNLKLLSESLENLDINFNFTYTKSEIGLTNTEFQSRIANARTGQEIKSVRDMAGQAPFIINAGLTYSGAKRGLWKDLEAGLYYNVQGETLQYVGMLDRPDIYLTSFHSLNFNVNKKLGKKNHFQVGLKIENLLNSKKQSVYKSFNANNQIFKYRSQGITFQLKLSYSL